jgi:hypothetical protein
MFYDSQYLFCVTYLMMARLCRKNILHCLHRWSDFPSVFPGKKIRVISGQYNASTSSPYSGSSLTIKTLIDKYPGSVYNVQEQGEK